MHSLVVDFQLRPRLPIVSFSIIFSLCSCLWMRFRVTVLDLFLEFALCYFSSYLSVSVKHGHYVAFYNKSEENFVLLFRLVRNCFCFHSVDQLIAVKKTIQLNNRSICIRLPFVSFVQIFAFMFFIIAPTLRASKLQREQNVFSSSSCCRRLV